MFCYRDPAREKLRACNLRRDLDANELYPTNDTVDALNSTELICYGWKNIHDTFGSSLGGYIVAFQPGDRRMRTDAQTLQPKREKLHLRRLLSTLDLSSVFNAG
jgi:hypothetical protein